MPPWAGSRLGVPGQEPSFQAPEGLHASDYTARLLEISVQGRGSAQKLHLLRVRKFPVLAMTEESEV